MKYSIHSFSIGIMFLLFMTACGSSATNESSAADQVASEINWSIDQKDISVEQIPTLNKKYPKLTIIDVRTPDEIANGKIKGAHQYDIQSKVFKKELSELNKEAPYLVYCAAGNRSDRACKVMEGLGFKSAYNLKGGYKAYLAKHH